MLIVHRGGSNIKAIASSTNSKIQITQKEDMASVATSERVVTITGNLEGCTACICKLLDAMAAQPNVSQYSNLTTSYKKSSVGSMTSSTVIGKFPPLQLGLGDLLPSMSSRTNIASRLPPPPITVGDRHPLSSRVAPHLQPQFGGTREVGSFDQAWSASANAFLTAESSTNTVAVPRLPGGNVMSARATATQAILPSPPLNSMSAPGAQIRTFQVSRFVSNHRSVIHKKLIFVRLNPPLFLSQL